MQHLQGDTTGQLKPPDDLDWAVGSYSRGPPADGTARTDLVVDVHVHGDAEALVVGVVARPHLHVLLLVPKVLDPPSEVPLAHVLGRNLCRFFSWVF